MVKRRATKSAIIWFDHIYTCLATGVCWSYTISNDYLKELYLYKFWIIETEFQTIGKTGIRGAESPVFRAVLYVLGVLLERAVQEIDSLF